jgi:cobalt-zinc-cadmium efflux system outer membrane protein
MASKSVRAGCTTFALAALLLGGCEHTPALLSDAGPLYSPYGVMTERGWRVEGPKKRSDREPVTQSAQASTPTEKDSSPPSPIQQVAALGTPIDKLPDMLPSPGPPNLPAPQAAPVPVNPVNPGTDPAAPGVGTLALGLAAAIETGLERNPDLVALRETEGVGRAVLGVARTYPFNPILQTRVLPLSINPDGTNAPTLNYVLLWQTFELAHQWRFRKEFAAAGLDNTRWTIQQAALQNVALTEQLYFAALYQRGLRDLSHRTAQLNDELLEVTERRFKAGRSSAADLALVRIDADSTRQQARLADITYRNALFALRRQLNLTDDAPLDLDGSLIDYVWHPVTGAELAKLTVSCAGFAECASGEALVAQLAGGRPDVLAARANFEAARANLGLANAARVPNVLIGPFYERDASAILTFGFQAQMEIPVINTGKPLVRQREAELRQRQVAFEQLEAKARVEARTALERYEQARVLCEQTRGPGGQQLPGELAKLEAAFKKGEIDILRISQARNSLIQFRRTYLDSLNELAQAAAVLTAATGLPPAAIVAPPHAGEVPPPCGAALEPLKGPATELPLPAGG